MIEVRMVAAAAAMAVGLGASLHAQDMSGMMGPPQPYVQKDVEYRGGMTGFSDKTKGSLLVTDSVTFRDKHDQRLFAIPTKSIDSIYGPEQKRPSFGKILVSNLNPTNKFHHDDDQEMLKLFVHTAAGSQTLEFAVKNGSSQVLGPLQQHGAPLPANMGLPKNMPTGYGTNPAPPAPDTSHSASGKAP